MKNICIVTGSRAEYGILYPLIKRLEQSHTFELQLIVAGSHLDKRYGHSVDEIINDGFKISKKVHVTPKDDLYESIAKTTGIGIVNFTDAFKSLKPDLIIILGDRFEILSAACSALLLRIPIAHIHGGEVTEGSFDESIRHAITKMSHLHFTSTEEYSKRVIQLGEAPSTVYNVGSLAVENIIKTKLLSKEELEKELEIKFKKQNFLITYHPETLSDERSSFNFKNLLSALKKFNDTLLIITLPNMDPENTLINELITKFVIENSDNAIGFNSLGRLKYLSTLQYVDCIVGNSSSGMIEAPLFMKPTVNIGDRQKGRLRFETIIDVNCNENDICNGIKKALNNKYNKISNVFGNGNSSQKIIEILTSIKFPIQMKKRFYDL